MMKPALHIILACGAVLTQAASAATLTTSGAWNNVANWNSNPNGDNIWIGTGSLSPAEATIGAGDILNSSWLVIGSNDGVSRKGTIAISGGSLTAAGDLHLGYGNSSTGIVDQTGGTITFTGGTTMIGGGQGGGSAYGFYNLSGAGSQLILNGAWMAIGYAASAVGEFTLSDGSFTCNSDVHIGLNGRGTLTQSGGAVTVGGNLNVGYAGPGTLTQSAGTIRANGVLFIGNGGSGTYTINGANAELYANGSYVSLGQNSGVTGVVNQSAGRVYISPNDFWFGLSGGTAIYNLSGGTLNAKDIKKGSGTAAINFTGGTLSANSVAFDLTNNGGAVAPGYSNTVGQTTIAGHYTVNSAGAALSLQLNGTTPATEYDRLIANSTASLGGLLLVGLGFTPQPSDTFTIVQATTVSGTFTNAAVSGGSYNLGGAIFRVTYSGTTVVLDQYAGVPPAAPSWIAGWPKADTATTDGFTVRAEIDEAGTAYYVVVADGAGAPNAVQVKAGQNAGGGAALKSGTISGLTASTEGTALVTGLAASTAYDVYVVGEDTVFRLQSSATKVDVSTIGSGDTTPPAWISGWPKADTATDSGFTVRAKIDEPGTVYYVVQLSGAGAPSVAQVMAGQNSGGGAALKSGSIGVAANTEGTAAVTGLAASTAYDVYFVAKDGVPNVQASVANAAVSTTADATPPSWTGGWPKADTATLTGFTVRAEINEAGTAYYVVVADGATAPSAAQVKAGNNASGAPALTSGSIVLTANSEGTAVVSVLDPTTPYDVYVVAQDATPNLQAAPVLINVSTVTRAPTTFNATVPGGSWRAATTWVENNGFPLTGDTVNQFQPGTVTLTDNAAANTLQIRNGGTVDTGVYRLTLNEIRMGIDGGGGGAIIRSAGSILTVSGTAYVGGGGASATMDLRTGDSLANMDVRDLGLVTQFGGVTVANTVGLRGGGAYALGSNSLSCSQLRLGIDGGGATFTRTAGSTLAVSGTAFVGGSAAALDLRTGDSIANLDIRSLGMVTQLGNVTVTSAVGLRDGAAYDLGSNRLSCNELRLGVDGGAASFTRSAGSVVTVVGPMYLGGGGGAASIDLKAGDSINNMDLRGQGAATSTVGGTAGMMGFTIGNWSDNGGSLTLTFKDPSAAGYEWALRWSGDRVNTLSNLVTAGKLILVDNASSGDPTITYNNLGDGYTYIGFVGAPKGSVYTFR